MRYIFPLLIFVIIVGILWKGLQQDPHRLPSTLINKSVVEFNYPSLGNPSQFVSNREFVGHVSLLNVWATWCITCQAEHAVLMEIARSKKVAVYGLNYKDTRNAAQLWLKKLGNPYQEIIFDEQGKLGIDLGVYGTPETFVIDAKGMIRYKHIGPISPTVWQEVLEPVVRKWS